MTRLAVALAAAVLFAVPAQAQTPCSSYDAIIAAVTGEKYKEARIAVGRTTDNSHVIEVYSAAGGRTFSIIITRPDGMTCIIGAGVGLETMAMPTAGSKT